MSEFEFQIKDIFTVPGKGMVIAGRIFSGKISTGDRIYVPTNNGKVETTVLGIKDRMQEITTAKVSFEGNNIGLRIDRVQGIVAGKASSSPDADDEEVLAAPRNGKNKRKKT